MKRVVSILLMVFTSVMVNTVAFSQLVDSFSDGDFTANPTWEGTITEWQIVTNSDVAAGAANSNTLRLNVASGSGTKYLSTKRTAPWGGDQTWGFWLGRRAQAATNQNHSVVWLWANEPDLTSATVDGYRIRFGDDGGNDEIQLQRVDNGTATAILSSTEAIQNGLTNIGFLVRVTRTRTSVWTLYTSPLPTTSGTGAIAADIPSAFNTPINQGSVTDSSYIDFSGGYFGFLAAHSTGANARAGAEFDQLYFAPQVDHPLPVMLISFTAQAIEGKVTLEWSTATETANLGFHLYRSLSEGGESTRITAELILGSGTSDKIHTYSYIDCGVESGETYYYTLAEMDYYGNVRLHGPISITVTETPQDFVLQQNFPNPLRQSQPATTINYKLRFAGRVKLTIYNLAGQAVRRLVDVYQPAGNYAVLWNGGDDRGQPVATGAYFYRLESNGFREVKKLLLTK